MTQNSNNDDMQARLDRAETVMADQDRQIEELSDMACAQWKEIDALKAELKKMREELMRLRQEDKGSAGAGSGEIDGETSLIDLLAQERPPHY